MSARFTFQASVEYRQIIFLSAQLPVSRHSFLINLRSPLVDKMGRVCAACGRNLPQSSYTANQYSKGKASRDVQVASTVTMLTTHLLGNPKAADTMNLVTRLSKLTTWEILLQQVLSDGWPRGITFLVLARAKHVFRSGSRRAQYSPMIISLSISRLSTRRWSWSIDSTS